MSQPASLDALLAADEFSEARLYTILRSLVREPSTNPADGETAVARRVLEWLSDVECEVTEVESLPGRFSLGVVIRGAHPGPRLVLNGHMDTVPVDDLEAWTDDPFSGAIRGGCVYGRGACDMKAGLSAQIAVAQYASTVVSDLCGELVLQFAVGEERGERGTASLLEAGFGGDYAVVGEPTGLSVAVAERGVAWFAVELSGLAGHAATSSAAANPVWAVERALALLAEYNLTLLSERHALLPPGSCTPTVVDGGRSYNSVPARCRLVIDRRLLPGETAAEELSRLREVFAPIDGADVRLLPGAMEPAEIAADSALATRLTRISSEVSSRRPAIFGYPYATDARVLINDGGIETVVFGAGDPGECHTADERVPLADVRLAAITLGALMRDTLSHESPALDTVGNLARHSGPA